VVAGVLYASHGPGQTILDQSSRDKFEPRISGSSAGGQQTNFGTEVPHDRGGYERNGSGIYSFEPVFADDETDGISSCPTAINCQLSLLCYERARELEHEILSSLQKLMVAPSAKENGSETVFVVYIVLTLMMDAYECYAISFQVCVSAVRQQRCCLFDTPLLE
jgi:hypothetical protein